MSDDQAKGIDLLSYEELEELRSEVSPEVFGAIAMGDQAAAESLDPMDLLGACTVIHYLLRRQDDPTWTKEQSRRVPLREIQAMVGGSAPDAPKLGAPSGSQRFSGASKKKR